MDLNRVIFFLKQTFNNWKQELCRMCSLQLIGNYWNALCSSSSHHWSVIFGELGELLSDHSLEIIIKIGVDVGVEEACSYPHRE